MECPRKDSWSWLPFPAPEDLPDPGTEPSSLVSAALAGRFFTTVPSGKPKCQFYWMPKPEMSICLRGSESSAFRTVNLEFHRKMLLLIKANLESGPSVPKCQSSIINSIVMNIAVHMSLSILVSSMCIPSSGIAGS